MKFSPLHILFWSLSSSLFMHPYICFTPSYLFWYYSFGLHFLVFHCLFVLSFISILSLLLLLLLHPLHASFNNEIVTSLRHIADLRNTCFYLYLFWLTLLFLSKPTFSCFLKHEICNVNSSSPMTCTPGFLDLQRGLFTPARSRPFPSKGDITTRQK